MGGYSVQGDLSNCIDARLRGVSLTPKGKRAPAKSLNALCCGTVRGNKKGRAVLETVARDAKAVATFWGTGEKEIRADRVFLAFSFELPASSITAPTRMQSPYVGPVVVVVTELIV